MLRPLRDVVGQLTPDEVYELSGFLEQFRSTSKTGAALQPIHGRS
jgi:hypothetical protein